MEIPRREIDKDFIWTWASECLVRGHTADLLRLQGLTGFSTGPAEITYDEVIAGGCYQELLVTGWGGIAKPQSGVQLLKSCPGCGHLEYSGVTSWEELIDWNQWDRSEMFIVWPLPRFILVTETGAEKLMTAGLTGAKLTPISDLPVQDRLSPGRVSRWLPREVLSRLNIPSEII